MGRPPLLLLLLPLSACSLIFQEATGHDAATSDAATSDAATSDAATSDAATSDAATSDAATPVSCPASWVAGNDHCYRYIEFADPLTAPAANLRCSEVAQASGLAGNGHLLVLNDSAEYELLQGLFNITSPALTGSYRAIGVPGSVTGQAHVHCTMETSASCVTPFTVSQSGNTCEELRLNGSNSQTGTVECIGDKIWCEVDSFPTINQPPSD